MLQKNPNIVQSEKFFTMSKRAKEFLSHGSDGFNPCIDLINEYLKEFGHESDKNELIVHRNKLSDIKRDERIGNTERQELNRLKSQLSRDLAEFVDSLQPKNEFTNQIEQTLRVTSEWDENSNLVTYINFQVGIDLKQLFEKLARDKIWKGLVREERRFLIDDEISNLIPDDFDFDNEEAIDFCLIDCKTESEIRFDLKSPNGGVFAGLLVEFYYNEFQICISANGLLPQKCEFMNELLLWFENQIEKLKLNDYSISIPKAINYQVQFQQEAETTINNYKVMMTQIVI